jgi:hypothetical protein
MNPALTVSVEPVDAEAEGCPTFEFNQQQANTNNNQSKVLINAVIGKVRTSPGRGTPIESPALL